MDASPAIEPLPAEPLRPAPAPDLDKAVAELGDQARAFARMPPLEKAALLRSLLPRIAAAAAEQVNVACRAKGLDPAGPLAGEEWLAGPAAVLANTRLLAESLEAIAARGRPDLPKAFLRDDDRAEVWWRRAGCTSARSTTASRPRCSSGGAAPQGGARRAGQLLPAEGARGRRVAHPRRRQRGEHRAHGRALPNSSSKATSPS